MNKKRLHLFLRGKYFKTDDVTMLTEHEGTYQVENDLSDLGEDLAKINEFGKQFREFYQDKYDVIYASLKIYVGH